uniref:Uncharacterized protein n=1 Tax=viral metagenome TaxID=1070528 RepID=A0A6H1ZQ48_9ZZZZ
MPETIPSPTETPGQRTMRRFYEGKLAERLLQAGQMAKDRIMLRRGAMKQQNGTLGQPSTSGEADPMSGDLTISVGDSIHYHQSAAESSAPQPPAKKPMGTLAKAALATALLGTGVGAGVGVPWLMGMFDKQPPPVEMPVDSLQQITVE